MNSSTNDYFLTAVRSAFSAVPWIGGALNEVVFDHRSRVKQRRFEEFVASLALEVERLEKNSLNLEKITSEEFGDLLEAVLRRAVSTSSLEKRSHLRDVLLKHIKGQVVSPNQDLFLDLVMGISEKEVEILNAFTMANASPKYKEEIRRSTFTEPFRFHNYYGLTEPDFRLAIQHLIARGLLFDDGIGRFDTSALEVIEVTELGRSFIDYLIQPSPQGK